MGSLDVAKCQLAGNTPPSAADTIVASSTSGAGGGLNSRSDDKNAAGMATDTPRKQHWLVMRRLIKGTGLPEMASRLCEIVWSRNTGRFAPYADFVMVGQA